MLVQWVLLPVTRRESWTVLGDDGPVQPIERYLAYLTDIERSPNTVRVYAHDLRDWFVFLAGQGLDWREVRLEDVAGFVAWLRRPPAARDGAVAVLPSAEHHCGESTVNRGPAQPRHDPVRGEPASGRPWPHHRRHVLAVRPGCLGPGQRRARTPRRGGAGQGVLLAGRGARRAGMRAAARRYRLHLGASRAPVPEAGQGGTLASTAGSRKRGLEPR
jgi:hypothetical protein